MYITLGGGGTTYIFAYSFIHLLYNHCHHRGNDLKSKDIMKCYCPHNSVIEEWGVTAIHLMKFYAFADGFHVNIYITLQGKI